jgi:hypothetical protein
VDDLVKLLQRLRDDAENGAQQLEAGQFKVLSVVAGGETVDVTVARAKIFRELAAELARAIELAGRS